MKYKRKNNILDILFIMIVIAVVTILFIIGVTIFNKVNDNVQSSEMLNVKDSETFNKMNIGFIKNVDRGIFLSIMVAFILLLISALLIEVNILYFVVAIAFYIIIALFAPMIANLVLGFQSSIELATVVSQMPLTNFYYTNFVLINMIMGAIVMILLYAKTRNS